MKPYLIAAAFSIGVAMVPAAANAKGCISGAAVGGVAGHVAGHHGLAGAAVGCAVGHHRAKVKAKRDAAQARAASEAEVPRNERIDAKATGTAK